MKVLSYDPELCVGCYICEEVCSDTWFKVADAEKSSIRIHENGEGNLAPSSATSVASALRSASPRLCTGIGRV